MSEFLNLYLIILGKPLDITEKATVHRKQTKITVKWSL